MLHLGDLKKDASAAPARSRARGAAPVPDWPARFAELASAARDPRLRPAGGIRGTGDVASPASRAPTGLQPRGCQRTLSPYSRPGWAYQSTSW